MQLDLKPDEAGTRYYDREKFTARHALICDLHIAGKPNWEIAELLNCSESNVSIWLGDQRAKAYIQAARDGIAKAMPDVLSRLETYALEAVDELVRQMREGTNQDKVKQTATFGILDRLGYSPIRKEIRANVRNPLSEDSLARMEEALEEANEAKRAFSFGVPREALEAPPRLGPSSDAVPRLASGESGE